MKTKGHDYLFLALLVLSLSVSCVSVFVPSITTGYTSRELGLEPPNDYDDRTTVTWGAPFPVVVDMPNSEHIGQKDERDFVSGAAFLANWLFYFVCAWATYLTFRVILVFAAFSARFIRAIIHPIDER